MLLLLVVVIVVEAKVAAVGVWEGFMGGSRRGWKAMGGGGSDVEKRGKGSTDKYF